MTIQDFIRIRPARKHRSASKAELLMTASASSEAAILPASLEVTTASANKPDTARRYRFFIKAIIRLVVRKTALEQGTTIV